jgi:hypothetical protein
MLFVSKLVNLNEIKNDISYDVICSLLQTLFLLRNIDRAICRLLLLILSIYGTQCHKGLPSFVCCILDTSLGKRRYL